MPVNKKKHEFQASQMRQAKEMLSEKDARFSQLCYRVFETTPAGRELMQLLIDEFLISMPMIDPRLTAAFGDHAIGVREGQNNLIRELYNRGVNYTTPEQKGEE